LKLFSGTPLSQFSDAPKPAHRPLAAVAATADMHVTEAPDAATAAIGAPEAATAAIGAPEARPQRKPRRPRVRAPHAAPDLSAPSHWRIVAIPRLAAGGRWQVEAMRSLSEPLLLWFTRGQGRITVGGETRGYGAHNAVFIPAGVMHGYEVGAQTFGSALFFGRGSEVTLPTDPLHLRIRDGGTQAELNLILDAIMRESECGKPGHDRAAHHYLGLLGVWLERQADMAASETRKPDAARRLARRYTDLLEQEFHSPMGVSDYAERLGVTSTHLTRVCNQACGRSASGLLHDRKIFEARRLLGETRLPVAEIARMLGFASAAYFTRAFQHHTAMTPSAFRHQG
jgi:AraC-like DNA-binding protein